MNAKKCRISLILVMAVLLANTALVSAYPADPPDTTPFTNTTSTSPCAEMAAANAAWIEIPSRSVDYASMEKLSNCVVIAGIRTIPVTGSRPDLGKQRYAESKMNQAERMSE